MGENDRNIGFGRLRKTRQQTNAVQPNQTMNNPRIVALLKRVVPLKNYKMWDYGRLSTKADKVKNLLESKEGKLLDPEDTKSLLALAKITDLPALTRKESHTIGVLLSTVVTKGKGNTAKARVTNGLSWLDEKIRSWGEQPSEEVLDNTISQLLEELKVADSNSLAPSKKYIAKRKANVTTPKTAALNVALVTELLIKSYTKENVSASKKQANEPTEQAVLKVRRLINSMKPGEKKKLLQRVQPLQKAATPNLPALQAVFTELLQRANKQKATNPFEPNANTAKILDTLQRISTAIENCDEATRPTLASTVITELNTISPITSTPKDRVDAIAKCLSIEITLENLPHYEMRDTVATIAEAVFETHDTVDEGLKWLNDAITRMQSLDVPTQNEAIQQLKAAAEQKLISKRLKVVSAATPRSTRAIVYHYTLSLLLRALYKGYTAIVNRFKARITSPEQKITVLQKNEELNKNKVEEKSIPESKPEVIHQTGSENKNAIEKDIVYLRNFIKQGHKVTPKKATGQSEELDPKTRKIIQKARSEDKSENVHNTKFITTGSDQRHKRSFGEVSPQLQRLKLEMVKESQARQHKSYGHFPDLTTYAPKDVAPTRPVHNEKLTQKHIRKTMSR